MAFDDLDTPLFDTTFVVVDLETTGTSPERDAITEIGAVKVRGGEVLGEFATLVNPGCAIPPQIIQVTGITTAMVLDAPRIEAVLPGFLEFAAGAVLVAHNARFDTGFLKAAGPGRGAPGGPVPGVWNGDNLPPGKCSSRKATNSARKRSTSSSKVSRTAILRSGRPPRRRRRIWC
ncbi:exonuclease domain-containing protein, partial [Nocardia wallacei]|uniref:exonuclease domain-containing protein n=1 Tax=Nocardia wallacei TaxID=480035 RepID=UPI003CC7ECF2